MYYRDEQDQLSMEEFFLPFGGRLRKDNRWVRLAEIMPWTHIEEIYVRNMSEETGRPGISSRIAYGSLYIKAHCLPIASAAAEADPAGDFCRVSVEYADYAAECDRTGSGGYYRRVRYSRVCQRTQGEKNSSASAGGFYGGYQYRPASGRVRVGLSFPGIVDSQANEIMQSHILGLSHMGLERFQRNISFPLTTGNDANCACLAEQEMARHSFVYISLNESVGGAIIMNRQLLLGDTFQAGEIGHMLLVPGGRPCYCGKSGCADAYLSPKALELDGWEVYLEHLAVLLTNLRMALNMDLVVGGEIGTQIGPYWDILYTKAALYDRFARDVDYIFPCMQL